MSNEINKPGDWKVKTVCSGANPDRYEYPFDIPQTVPKGTATGDGIKGWDAGGNRNRRPAD